MKHLFKSGFIAIAILLNSCTNGQNSATKTDLSPVEFSEKIKEHPAAPVIDVRTPEEFGNGHLKNAQNIDWNGSSFENEIASLDKSKPVMVYCQSGGRSSSAANKMRNEGFSQVYELKGGIMAWRSAGLEETKGLATPSRGMSKQQFDDLLITDKLVLIDFYAEWCAPCKKMKPYLDEITSEMANEVTVVRIDADANQSLSKELNIDALPTLLIYKNNTLLWKNVGYIEKAGVLEQLKK